jgi:hypothetical protein
MWIITLVAVLGILALVLAGAIPKASVGGPLTIAFLFFLAMLAVGIHEAWTKRRGVLGWILSLAVAVVGGLVAAGLGMQALEALLPYLDLNGSLAASHHPMRYVSYAGMMLLSIWGAWLALRIVGRFR